MHPVAGGSNAAGSLSGGRVAAAANRTQFVSINSILMAANGCLYGHRHGIFAANATFTQPVRAAAAGETRSGETRS